MDKETVEKVKKELRRIAESEGLKMEKVLLFGSRARNDYSESSDVDLLIISDDFQGTAWYKRGKEFHYNWNYEELPEPEIICLTKEEFERRRKKKGDIVRKASDEGVAIA